MRVLILTHALPNPSAPNTLAPLLHQIESLRKIGVKIDLLEVKGKAKVKYFQAWPNLIKAISSVDLVHAHYGFYGWLGRLQLNRPVVVSFMGSDILGSPDKSGKIPLSGYIEIFSSKVLARIVNAVIVKSSEMAKAISPVHAHIIPNGVDMDAFRPMDAQVTRSRLGWDLNKYYILFPGNPEDPRKNYSLAYQSIELTSRKINKPIEIITLKKIPHDTVPLYMNASDLIVFTSYIEGSPNVIKEGMACNRPIISSPVGDVQDLIGDVEGCAIVPRDVEQFSQAISSSLIHKASIRGREKLIDKGLDLISVAKNIYSVYESILD